MKTIAVNVNVLNKNDELQTRYTHFLQERVSA